MWEKVKYIVRQILNADGRGLCHGVPRRISGVVLAVLFAMTALVGCSKGQSGDTDKIQSGQSQAGTDGESSSGGASGGVGRFVEEEIPMPEGYSQPVAVRVLSDGSVCVIAKSETTYALLTSQDMGQTWETADIEGIDPEMIQTTAIAPDGGAAFVEYSGDVNVPLYYREAGGSLRELSVGLESEDGYNGIWQMQFDEKGTLFAVDYTGELLKIDLADGSFTQPLDMQGSSVSYFGIAGTTLFAVHTEGMYLFDTETGDQMEDQEVLNELIASDTALQYISTDRGLPLVITGSAQENGILLADHEGIFHFTLGGSIKEQLVDGSMNSLSSVADVLTSMAMVDEDHILVVVYGEEPRLLCYSYDENASAMPETELTVYSLYDSTALRTGITVFQKAYPDIYVNLQIGLPEDDSGMTLEDALKALSTEILAGNGPDVLVLDDMPVESYIEKGILADISDLVKEADDAEGLFSNIVEGSRRADGGIYAMPLRFLAEFVQGDARTVEAAGSFSSLADRAEELKGTEGYKRVLPVKGIENMLYELYHADSAGWVRDDGTLDEEKLKDFFTQAKRLYDIDGGDERDELMSVFTFNSFAELGGTLSSLGTLSKTNMLEYGSMAGMNELQMAVSVMEETGDTYGLLNNGETASYIPYLQVGVNASGDVDNARAFIKTLLGSDAQADSNGFPVNRAAYDTLAQKLMTETESSSIGVSIQGSSDDGMISLDLIQPTQEQIDTCTALLESVKTPALMDGVIRNLVIEQGKAYLSGEQSLEETLEQVQKKVSLYLAE